jgi:hypothetical protein
MLIDHTPDGSILRTQCNTPMAMIQFDAATARLLENAYRGRDVVKRRLATLQALAPEAGA